MLVSKIYLELILQLQIALFIVNNNWGMDNIGVGLVRLLSPRWLICSPFAKKGEEDLAVW